MRRRAAEFRRPVRRRFSKWIWGLLGLFSMAALALFVVQHNHQDQIESPIKEKAAEFEHFQHEKSNFTEEILSVTSFSRQLGDQMTLAKAYVIIAKEHNNLQLAWELSSKIRSCQLLLSRAAMSGVSITLDDAQPLVKDLSLLIYKAQDAHYDIATTIMTMKSHIQALEERANVATVQSTAFGQLAAEALPKSLHCLSIKLTTDWLSNSIMHEVVNEKKNSPRLVDNNLYHFCIFSDNVIATSAVVNSTVSNADHPKQLVFHIVTNGISYGAMQSWFYTNNFQGSTIEVQKIEEFSWLNISYSPVIKQLHDPEYRSYYFGASQDSKGELKFRNPKFLSLLNHLRFYIPEIYPSLEKVVFLDDDVVVQKDLTPLFSLDLHGNVNGAVETCLEAFHRFYKYLNFSNPTISSKFDPQACGWAFGMNVFDLIAWKNANVTERYHYWLEQNSDRTLWKLGTLPPGLLTFYGLTEPLDRRWHVLGLGYDMNIDNRLIESAAVIHFNGNMKPWLKLAIDRYKPLWERGALTEKKMDMTLEDIIKMSKKPSPSKTIKNQRVPNKNQKPLNGVPAKGNIMKVRQYMDSRSSIRQGALAQRRSSFHGNQFPLANEAARRAVVAPLRSWPVNRTGMNNWNKQRIGVPPVQRRAEVGFAVKARQPVKVNKRPGTLDTLFANMKEQRMRGQTQQNGNNMKEQRRRVQGQQNGNNIRRGAGVQQRRYGRARFANYAN